MCRDALTVMPRLSQRTWTLPSHTESGWQGQPAGGPP